MAELGSGNGSGYPAVLDTDNIAEVNTPAPGRTMTNANTPNDLGAAFVAVENELGTDPAGALADVKTLLQVGHQTNGLHKYNVVSKSANYTATTSDDVILCTNTITIDLFTTQFANGKLLTIVNVGTGVVTVDSSDINIGFFGVQYFTMNSTWSFLAVIFDSDAFTWKIVELQGLVFEGPFVS